MPFIEVQHLDKFYNNNHCLKDLNLNVESGEIYAVIGPSGAGKTTLLRLINLLDKPTRGKIFFDNIDTDCSSKMRLQLQRRMGMIFQQAVMFNMSVYGNIAYGLKLRGSNKNEIDKKVKNVLELVGLRGFEKRNALTLSVGEAQRVALARVIATEPELLLLDEPTADLDPKNVAIIEGVISHINREDKTTIIIVTHNMPQAERLAEKLALLNEGRLTEMGRTDEVFRRPSSGILASFIRFENIFSGKSSLTEDGTALIDIEGGIQIEAITKKKGHVVAFIRPEDILVSRVPITSSARNMFKGKITEILDANAMIRLKVNVGVEFTVLVTRKSFLEMGLNIDHPVFITFKASSVQII
jgi:tungstate transport system ATP-binding protein